jgi:hypothetical protein
MKLSSSNAYIRISGTVDSAQSGAPWIHLTVSSGVVIVVLLGYCAVLPRGAERSA